MNYKRDRYLLSKTGYIVLLIVLLFTDYIFGFEYWNEQSQGGKIMLIVLNVLFILLFINRFSKSKKDKEKKIVEDKQ